MEKHIILADNQSITCIGLKHLILDIAHPDSCHIYTVHSKKELISILIQSPNSSIILDYTLFDFASPDELLILSQRYPEANWLLCSDDLSDSFLRQLAAHDFPFSIVLKNCELDEIQSAITSLLNITLFLCKSIKAHIATLNKQTLEITDNTLTQTEKEILKEIASGKTTKEIASIRNLSFHTIITHRKNIFRKLGVNNIHEATKYAFKAGIVDFSEYYI